MRLTKKNVNTLEGDDPNESTIKWLLATLVHMSLYMPIQNVYLTTHAHTIGHVHATGV